MTPEGGPTTSRFEDAVLAAALFAIDPHGMGGVRVHAMPGPVRDEWLALLSEMLPPATPFRRIPVNVTVGRLLGGLDLTATLQTGKPVAASGLLAECDGGVAHLVMAERVQPEIAAHISQALDRGTVTTARDGITATAPARFGVVLMDEGLDADEQPPASVLDRVAFMIDLEGIPIDDLGVDMPTAKEIAAARDLMPAVGVDDDVLRVLAEVSVGLGIASLRPVLLALAAAKAHAALMGRTAVQRDDAVQSARLVLACRATVMPPAAEQEPDEEPEQQQDSTPEPDDTDDVPEISAEDIERALEDVVLEAAQAAIPPGLLARLKAGAMARAQGRAGGRAGGVRMGKRRGRPAGVRAGDPARGERINVIETLRAAAPWQALRRKETGGERIHVRREDFRVTRFKERTETTTVFVVDASGSQALNRLAEVKGAVELLLAECYVRRDQVALIAFRNTDAELVLPPTRSLVRAKRALAGLPGGGGTPLARGLDLARLVTDGCARKGQTPVIVVMTDGRANIARDGTGGRDAAEADAADAARMLRADGRLAIVVDTSPRPQPDAKEIARELDALYLPLPRADAVVLSEAVGGAAAGRHAR